jgi:hypothetical protein
MGGSDSRRRKTQLSESCRERRRNGDPKQLEIGYDVEYSPTLSISTIDLPTGTEM